MKVRNSELRDKDIPEYSDGVKSDVAEVTAFARYGIF